MKWIPVTYHDITEEEKEEYGNEIVFVLDCPLPDDGEEILVSHKNGKWVDATECVVYEGYGLENGWDWIEDISAWMPFPKPYKGGE